LTVNPDFFRYSIEKFVGIAIIQNLGFRLTKIPLKYFIHAIVALKLLLICDGMIGMQPFLSA
jgi:hypothetical protein